MIELRQIAPHPSDEQLLLASDRESSPRDAAKLREHLADCPACRDRAAVLESTLANFVALHEIRAQAETPSDPASRAALKALLAGTRRRPLLPLWPSALPLKQLAGVSVALVLVAASVWAIRVFPSRTLFGSADQLASALPQTRLTPGATRPVRLDDLCGARDPAHLRVNDSLEHQVFVEYGLPVSSRPGYELDYLITPELGGSADIHNLWPEPYFSTSWNAHVKDKLENHLHEMVCQGKLPLSTAQSEIATNWIAAYKRYFHTDQPLTDAASLASPAARDAKFALPGISTGGPPAL